MKKLLFGLLATIILTFTTNAQSNFKREGGERAESAYISVKTGDELVKYKFSSIKDFEENSDKILDEITPKSNSNGSTSKPESDAVKCEVTVEISISVNTGEVLTTVSATVTTGCVELATIMKKLRTQLTTSIIG